jgi:hypothetical protein
MQVPPSLAQCLQYLQFLHAEHGSLPVQVEYNVSLVAPMRSGNRSNASHKWLLRTIRHLE